MDLNVPKQAVGHVRDSVTNMKGGVGIKFKEDNEIFKDFLKVIGRVRVHHSMLEQQSGSGQAERNAYEVQKDGGYGALIVDFGKLLNLIARHAYRDGNQVYDRSVDKAIVDLSTKRYNPKTN